MTERFKKTGSTQVDLRDDITQKQADDAVALLSTFFFQQRLTEGKFDSRTIVANFVITTTYTMKQDIQEFAGQA